MRTFLRNLADKLGLSAGRTKIERLRLDWASKHEKQSRAQAQTERLEQKRQQDHEEIQRADEERGAEQKNHISPQRGRFLRGMSVWVAEVKIMLPRSLKLGFLKFSESLLIFSETKFETKLYPIVMLVSSILIFLGLLLDIWRYSALDTGWLLSQTGLSDALSFYTYKLESLYHDTIEKTKALLFLLLILNVIFLIMFNTIVFLRLIRHVGWPLFRIWHPADWHRTRLLLLGFLVSLVSSSAFSLLITLITLLINQIALLTTVHPLTLIGLAITLTLTLGLPWIFPILWRLSESVWWKLTLGTSTPAQMVTEAILRDFQLSIAQKKIDKILQDSIAVAYALTIRAGNFPFLQYEWTKRKNEREKQVYESNIEQMNNGWKLNNSPDILRAYANDTLELSKKMKKQAKLYGRCAVAIVKYFLGDIKEPKRFMEKDWKIVTNNSALQWSVSYPYFAVEALGYGEFVSTLKEMIKHWNDNYVFKSLKERQDIIAYSYGLVLHPVLARPRNILLTAAFSKGLSRHKLRNWPSVAREGSKGLLKNEYKTRVLINKHKTILLRNGLPVNNIIFEFEWAKAWYEEAEAVCKVAQYMNINYTTSLDFDHACAAFYFIVLCLDRRCSVNMIEIFSKAADDAIRKIGSTESRSSKKTSSSAANYGKFGVRGIYQLAISKEPELALVNFRKAVRHSNFSGIKFGIVDYLFMCCHAVAAQKFAIQQETEGINRPDLVLEVNRYLKETRKIAENIGSSFYFDLYDAAYAEICRLREDEDLATRIDNRLKKRDTEERVLQLFRQDFLRENKQREYEPKSTGQVIRSAINRTFRDIEPELLKDYRDGLRAPTSMPADEREMLLNQCVIATVDFLLGNVQEAALCAEQNWQLAEELGQNAEDYSVLKWEASYAYFNTIAHGSGELTKAMILMLEHWNRHYVSLSEVERAELIGNLAGLVIHPVLTLPRNIIIIAAFNESPIAPTFSESVENQKLYWPSVTRQGLRFDLNKVREEYKHFTSDELIVELEWVKSWCKEADYLETLCKETEDILEYIHVGSEISRAYSYAYAGYYFTLLSLDPRYNDNKEELRQEANDALEKISCHYDEDQSKKPHTVQYIESGFYGVYELAIEENPQRALENLRKAAQHSDFSGNKVAFIDCLFMCYRAVAAQRTGFDLKLEADRYLKEARKLAENIGSNFYLDICDAADSEVHRLRGDSGEAARIDAKLRMGQAKERVIRTFRKTFRKFDS